MSHGFGPHSVSDEAAGLLFIAAINSKTHHCDREFTVQRLGASGGRPGGRRLLSGAARPGARSLKIQTMARWLLNSGLW